MSSRTSSTPIIVNSAAPRASTGTSLQSGTRCCSTSTSTWTRWSPISLLCVFSLRSAVHKGLTMFPVTAQAWTRRAEAVYELQRLPRQPHGTPQERLSDPALLRPTHKGDRSQVCGSDHVRLLLLYFAATTADSSVISSLKRQLDSRLKQLDRFESSIKSATDTQRQWRQRLGTKQSELDSAKVRSSFLLFWMSLTSLPTGNVQRASDPDHLPPSAHFRCRLRSRHSHQDHRPHHARLNRRTKSHRIPDAARECGGQARRGEEEGLGCGGQVGGEVAGTRDAVEGSGGEAKEGAAGGEGEGGRPGCDDRVRSVSFSSGEAC